MVTFTMSTVSQYLRYTADKKKIVKFATVMKEMMNYQFYLSYVSFVTLNNRTCLVQGHSSTKNGHFAPMKAPS